jgi:high-affinity Fe2+/Pb2+ permease
MANAGNIIVGGIVFGVLALIIIRLIIKFRRGKSSCNCGGCSKCG